VIPSTRKMVVVRAPGSDDTPMIRITNKLLADVGFEIGTGIEVSYRKDKITIKKLDKNYERNSNIPIPPNQLIQGEAKVIQSGKAGAPSERGIGKMSWYLPTYCTS